MKTDWRERRMLGDKVRKTVVTKKKEQTGMILNTVREKQCKETGEKIYYFVFSLTLCFPLLFLLYPWHRNITSVNTCFTL